MRGGAGGCRSPMDGRGGDSGAGGTKRNGGGETCSKAGAEEEDRGNSNDGGTGEREEKNDGVTAGEKHQLRSREEVPCGWGIPGGECRQNC